MENPASGSEYIAEICLKKGMTDVVISPGSRNAPLIQAFTKRKGFNCLSIIDERSAAYFALGMSKCTGKVVGLICTSGTAVLNYAPAIAEAYYQNVPLLVITADRPAEHIDIADNQTIRQNNIYRNYIKKSFRFPVDLSRPESLRYAVRIINEAFDQCLIPGMGPVHVNVPLHEPLYKAEYIEENEKLIIHSSFAKKSLLDNEKRRLSDIWATAKGKLIICGMMDPNPELNDVLAQIAQDPDVVILKENLANLHDENFLENPDLLLSIIKEKDISEYQPDLLITFGSHVVSKKLKQFLKNIPPREHWHIDENNFYADTYLNLTENIGVSAVSFFSSFSVEKLSNPESSFSLVWKKLLSEAEKQSQTFLNDCEYSDLKVFEILSKRIPGSGILCMGNSSPIRYFQYFQSQPDLKYYANRGTSGIDGAVSTAAGYAYSSQKPVSLVVGDLGFFYDSNGTWNQYLPSNFRIIVINNGGGGIFRLIEGPDKTGVMEEFFETSHNYSVKGIAEAFRLKYFSADNTKKLEETLKVFYAEDNSQPSVLEIFTPAEKNAEVFKAYIASFTNE